MRFGDLIGPLPNGDTGGVQMSYDKMEVRPREWEKTSLKLNFEPGLALPSLCGPS